MPDKILLPNDPPVPFHLSDAIRLHIVADRVNMLVKLSWVGLSGMISIGVGIIVTLLLR